MFCSKHVRGYSCVNFIPRNRTDERINIYYIIVLEIAYEFGHPGPTWNWSFQIGHFSRIGLHSETALGDLPLGKPPSLTAEECGVRRLKVGEGGQAPLILNDVQRPVRKL